ncbi:hypothetical protein [Sphingobacterium multivorum]|uniref:hypothetical protein n=1 Tax=Sphingobacterium multivorum TaxID=28454 RepID=UPI0028B192EB|nr:hypothetical protein [Sphingobacterium multivorum]
MSELRDFINKLKRIRDELPSFVEDVSTSIALNHKALVVNRIQSEGIPGEVYSDKGVPAYFYAGFSSTAGKNKGKTYDSSYPRLNSGFDRMIEKKLKKKESVSWKDVREANGLQTNHVDFTFSGRTFQNLNVVSVERSGFVSKAYLGANDPEVAQRLFYGFHQYGDFLQPNEKERKMLNEMAGKMLTDFFDKL